MKRQTRIVLLFLIIVGLVHAQSPPGNQSHAHDYWIDPSTGLMWAGKDNGKDVNWHKAMKYCRDLRLAGYSDWRLATLGELEGIYDKSANSPGLMGPSGNGTASTWHVKETCS